MAHRMTYGMLCGVIRQHNEKHNVTTQFADKHRLNCVVVFKQESWPDAPREYTEKERSYRFVSDNKAFIDGMGGNSIFADCLDGTDEGIRLDWYMMNGWKVEYCYIENENEI